VASYKLSGDNKQIFRFFEERSWFEDEEYYSNEYFKFEIKENDLKSLGLTYCAHINLWWSECQNNFIEDEYQITKYAESIREELENNGINYDGPSFGYENENLGIIAIAWDDPEFEIININDAGVECKDEDLDVYYFDFISSDICDINDVKLSSKKPKRGSVFKINPGDPVFMVDHAFDVVKKDFIEKINKLNVIYSKVGFPYKINIL
jgi:hypothetical protein